MAALLPGLLGLSVVLGASGKRAEPERGVVAMSGPGPVKELYRRSISAVGPISSAGKPALGRHPPPPFWVPNRGTPTDLGPADVFVCKQVKPQPRPQPRRAASA